jgi:hypothetical protein
MTLTSQGHMSLASSPCVSGASSCLRRKGNPLTTVAREDRPLGERRESRDRIETYARELLRAAAGAVVRLLKQAGNAGKERRGRKCR